MKSSKDMARSVLLRSEAILKKRAKRRRNLRIAGSIVLLLLIFLNVVNDNGLDRPGVTQPLPTPTGPVLNTKPTVPPSEPYNLQIIWAEDGGALDAGEVDWSNKIITVSLYTAFYDERYVGKEGVFAIGLIFRDYDGQFAYEGKTLSEYCLEKNEERKIIDKLTDLLKDGEFLKYGEKLYTTGTPDGVIWPKELYENVVAQYTEVFLDKYIADGIFLKDKVAEDLLILAEKPAESQFNDAVAAYLLEKTQYVQNVLQKNGISCDTLWMSDGSVAALGGVALVLYATQEQFQNIVLDEFGINKNDVVFTFAAKTVLDQTGGKFLKDLICN